RFSGREDSRCRINGVGPPEDLALSFPFAGNQKVARRLLERVVRDNELLELHRRVVFLAMRLHLACSAHCRNGQYNAAQTPETFCKNRTQHVKYPFAIWMECRPACWWWPPSSRSFFI